MGKKKTTEEFIKEAREKHKDKYKYTKVNYVGAFNKVCIICSEHGEFWQVPHNHLCGNGCPECANEAMGERCRSSKEDFIKKAIEIHGDKYDYSKVDYVKAIKKVCIICSEHGEFWQTPASHTQGNGCPECGQNEMWNKRGRMTTEKIVEKFTSVHGHKYDYSKVDYMGCKINVCIICPEHGEFEQTPDKHIQGQGCPKCGQIIRNDSKRSSTSDFIEKSREVHKNKYDYSKVKYVNNHTKVCIICPEHGHGEFWQTPSAHLQGTGCPKCNLSHLERSVMNYLDEHEIAYDYQKRFNWLGRQSLDFYLPDYKVGIECQGKQHFFPVDFAGKGVEWACKEFDKLISRDKRKKALCEKHGIKLLYFGNVPNYNTFLGEVVHNNVKHLIDYLEEHKKENKQCKICSS